MKTQKNKHVNGFTLVEALFAAMLLGLVIAALAAASGYLQERVLPNHPKRPGFYMDYYQTVVEPELKEKIQKMVETQGP